MKKSQKVAELLRDMHMKIAILADHANYHNLVLADELNALKADNKRISSEIREVLGDE